MFTAYFSSSRFFIVSQKTFFRPLNFSLSHRKSEAYTCLEHICCRHHRCHAFAIAIAAAIAAAKLSCSRSAAVS
jgi:hypothetical protein